MVKKKINSENHITSLQEITIRRINRQFQIERKGSILTATLPLSVKRTKKGQVQTETHNRFLTLENTGNGFRAVIQTKTFWKRSYWRRWREQTGNEVVITSANFNALAAIIKLEIEK